MDLADLFRHSFVSGLRFLLTVALLGGLAAMSLPAGASTPLAAGGRDKKAEPSPDTLIFNNGDRLSGRLLHSAGGSVWFHSDILGEIQVKWDKIEELQTRSRMVVLRKSVFTRGRTLPESLPQGNLTFKDHLITVYPANGATIPPIPIKNVEYIVDEDTLRKQIAGHPGILAGWNGSLTAGAALVQATEDQYTFSGAASLARIAPTVAWLNTNTRSLIDFSGSFGKIIQPAYTSNGVTTPSSSSKSSIYHADAERDQYFSPRFYALGQTVFDHNYSQELDLQSIFGAGIGWTATKSPTQELDLKTTLQYESQTFLDASASADQNLIGSTLNSTWAAKLPLNIVFKQQVSWIPAYNNTSAYSAGETNSLTMPFFKRLAFSLGSTDSYLNDPPPGSQQTKRNSFQFTTGFTYGIKSSY